MPTKYSYPAQVWKLAEQIAKAIRDQYLVGWLDFDDSFQSINIETLTIIVADEIMRRWQIAQNQN